MTWIAALTFGIAALLVKAIFYPSPGHNPPEIYALLSLRGVAWLSGLAGGLIGGALAWSQSRWAGEKVPSEGGRVTL